MMMEVVISIVLMITTNKKKHVKPLTSSDTDNDLSQSENINDDTDDELGQNINGDSNDLASGKMLLKQMNIFQQIIFTYFLKLQIYKFLMILLSSMIYLRCSIQMNTQ